MRQFITSCYKFASQYLPVLDDAESSSSSESYRSSTPTRFLPSVRHMFDEEGYFEESDDDSSTEGENTFPELPDEYSAFRMDIEADYFRRSPSSRMEGVPGKSTLTCHDLSPSLTS